LAGEFEGTHLDALGVLDAMSSDLDLHGHLYPVFAESLDE
jgi:hypothetical protein